MITRRDLLAATPGLAAGFLAGRQTLSTPEPATPEAPTRALRVAHLTDIHLLPGKLPEESLVRVLHQVQEQGADLIVNGGDLIFDASKTPREQVEQQWSVVNRLLKSENSLPIFHTLGNHDIFGWATPQREASSKQQALERLSLERGYYSFEKAGWKLLVLDSVAYSPERISGYVAKLGEEQFFWLKQELESTQMPVCLISHIPILAVCPLFDGPNEQSGSWSLPAEWMHVDARPIKNLLVKHKVKLCLSGHIHLADHLQYAGVDFFCNGAVCGKYWEGAYQEFPPAYALVDLYTDGTFHNALIPY